MLLLNALYRKASRLQESKQDRTNFLAIIALQGNCQRSSPITKRLILHLGLETRVKTDNPSQK